MTTSVHEHADKPSGWLKWLIYPLSWAWLGLIYSLALTGQFELQTGWLIFVLTMVVALICLEIVAPLKPRWGASAGSIGNDLKYLVGNGATVAITSSALAMFSISMSGELDGMGRDWPMWLQLIVLILVFEALQYGLHRFEHEGGGRVGRFMWRVHAAHHLPERLYVVMHVAGHPINAALVQGVILIVPIWLIGYDAQVVTLFLMINTMHGLISHFNVDVRLGWMNYLFVGPELHRYHHSRAVDEAKNYGATISLYDQLFGTFVYRPDRLPTALGAGDEDFPRYGQFIKVLALPFRRTRD